MSLKENVIYVDEVCNNCRNSGLEHCMKCTTFQIKKILATRGENPEYRTYHRENMNVYRYSDRWNEQRAIIKAQEQRQREGNYMEVDGEIVPCE